MIKLKLGIVLSTIITLTGITSQVTLGDSFNSNTVSVVVANRHTVNDATNGTDLIESFFGLVSSLREKELFAFIETTSSTANLGPVIANTREFYEFQSQLKTTLENPKTTNTDSNLVDALVEAYNLLGSQRAAPGSTVYLITSSISKNDSIQLSKTLKPILNLIEDQDWTVVELILNRNHLEDPEVPETISTTLGINSFNIYLSTGFEKLSHMLLGYNIEEFVSQSTQDVLSPNTQITSSFGITPGTNKVTLLLFRDSPFSSVVLTNPKGFQVNGNPNTSLTSIETPNLVIWKFTDPETGGWKIDIYGNEGSFAIWDYTDNKHTLVLESFGVIPLNEPIALVAFVVTDVGEKVTLPEATVTAIIKTPNGTTMTKTLQDEGTFGDLIAADGYYSAIISPAVVPGEYSVELLLSWPHLEQQIISTASFQVEAFPTIEFNQIDTENLRPEETSLVGTIFVHIAGQPYAVSSGDLLAALASDLEQEANLEIMSKQTLENGKAWEYNVFFTPEQEGITTVVIRLTTTHENKQYTYTSDTIVLHSIMPAKEETVEVVTPNTTPPPTPVTKQQLTTEQPQLEPSNLSTILLSISVIILVVIASYFIYWYSRPNPYGYLYDDRNNETVASFGDLKRSTLMKLFFKSYVRGENLGVSGLHGVWFKFAKTSVSITDHNETPKVRINDNPLISTSTIQDGTWIGVHGKLYTFLISKPTSDQNKS